MRIEEDIYLDFDDVLIRPKRSTLKSRSDVSLERTFKFRNGNVWSGIPIVAANMDTVGNIGTALVFQEQKMLTCLHKFIDKDSDFNYRNQLDSKYFSPTIGIQDIAHLHYYQDIEFITIDVANGYTERFVNYIKQFRNDYPKINIIAGNVATPEMTEELILAGVDIVKVGIGSGSGCLTRQKAGVGVPQLSAIIECADAAHGLGGFIISDGGCRYPSDVAKSFAAGADFVMLGGMLAGHEENSQFDSDGNTLFYGMSSKTAMEKHYGSVSKHRTSEGRTIKLKSKGPLENTIRDILGGVRSACTYVGASKLKELTKRTTFLKVNRPLNTYYKDQSIGE